jgi:hypothetical protein
MKAAIAKLRTNVTFARLRHGKKQEIKHEMSKITFEWYKILHEI